MKKHISCVLSQTFYKFATKEFNPKIQNFINTSYVKFLKLDMSEFCCPTDYPTLNKLFTRELIKERFIDTSITSVISPCDSKIVDVGKIKHERAYQIKGKSYLIAPFIGGENLDELDNLEGGEYINFYLSPKDYHRYHAPFDMEVLSILHIPGKLFPVNIPLLKKKRNLYIENERVVLKVKDRFNHIHFIILVGALNVGKMVVTFEQKINTNTKDAKRLYIKYDKPKFVKKGELFGWFEMGSTIVILSQKDAVKWNVNIMQRVKFADVVGELNDN